MSLEFMKLLINPKLMVYRIRIELKPLIQMHVRNIAVVMVLAILMAHHHLQQKYRPAFANLRGMDGPARACFIAYDQHTFSWKLMTQILFGKTG